MSTTITMYDCGFGDCFKISYNKEESYINPSECLYVDFGIHHMCNNKENWKENTYNTIIDEIPANADFLLTHYHYDHFSGLIHMSKNSEKKFKNVYIPDIWGISDSVKIVQFLLMEDFFRASIIKKNLTLFDLLTALCHSTGYIHFVKRGQNIQNRYIALYPTEEKIQAVASSSSQKLKDIFWQQNIDYIYKDSFSQILNDIYDISQKLCKTMRLIYDNSKKLEEWELDPQERSREQLELRELSSFVYEIEALKTDFLNIRENFTKSNLPVLYLPKLENKINIIFQNKSEKYPNLLFTGDAENSPELWNSLKSTTDNLQLYKSYDVIKIPHHGTAGHYYDFSDISNFNTIYLIPNGHISRKSWFISEAYLNDAYKNNCFICCFGKDSCNAICSICNHISKYARYASPYFIILKSSNTCIEIAYK